MTEEKTETIEEQMSTEKIQQLLEQDQDARVRKCKSEMDVLLQKYGCQLVTIPQITSDGRLRAAAFIQITPEGDSK